MNAVLDTDRREQPVDLPGWTQLRHGGLLLDPARQRRIAEQKPAALSPWVERELRRRAAAIFDGGPSAAAADIGAFVAFVLETICGFDADTGTWQRGAAVGSEWGRRAITGETVKPRHLWRDGQGSTVPVFIDVETRIGIGRGRKAASQVLQWLRGGDQRLALLTNGRQWRLIFAGLDIDAWCEWDADLWFDEGALSEQVEALRTLVQPALWTRPTASSDRGDEGAIVTVAASGIANAPTPLEQAILDSRKGQADLSTVLGERVREAVELLVQGHGEAFRRQESGADSAQESGADSATDVRLISNVDLGIDPADIYRAAVRVVMRLVVILFAESRDLLPRDNTLYHDSYGLGGLIEELEKTAARGSARLARSYSAWPRVLALFRLVYEGSPHPALPVPAYGGELFAPGDPDASDGPSRALAVFERACFAREVLPDRDVHRMLHLITRTRVKLRQGRTNTWVAAPVDFSDLSSEYIGILYEGLLDYELKTAPAGDPVIFLNVGNAPALPLSRLEAMDDTAIAGLLESMKQAAAPDPGDEEEASSEQAADEDADEDAVAEDDNAASTDEPEEAPDEPSIVAATPEDTSSAEVAGSDDDAADVTDERHVTRTRAEQWARRAVAVGKLVRLARGALTPEKRLAHEDALARAARGLVDRVVLPGEWYVVRWGGTRKGSGTFYTRPGLAVPTVQRTLRPLAYDPPSGAGGLPDRDAPASAWVPKPPEQILALKVCDPACGSGTFPVAALRYLTEALYESLHHHGRISEQGERALVHLIEPPVQTEPPASLAGANVAEEHLGHELLPCRTDDETFEPRLKALLRRHVVERCIYGVDLDPLAVELARLSLWIETMDRELPFSFLDHKVKCGNALVGAWFDTFRHYPVMAFKNREGGDKAHSNGVHFAKDARGKELKAFVKDVLTPDLRDFLIGQLRIHDAAELADKAKAVHDGALATLARLHDLPVQDAAERARIYRDELVGSPAYRQIKEAMDLWCACWFWPADRLDEAPLPTTLAAPPEPAVALATRIAAEKRFFHWELEFPDVFRAAGAGFDAVLGNPPWETLQPNSKEYFSNIDPLYRSYGKQEALRKQTGYFAYEPAERDWLDYNTDFGCSSNWMKYAASPFGDPAHGAPGADRFAVSRGGDNAFMHARWSEVRAVSHGYADPRHPFRHRGEGKAYTYKLFLEQAHALLRPGGRLGFIVPSGLYSDHGTGELRELFLDHCRWEWLFGFENRDGIFDIHRSFKFNPVVIEKGGRTAAIRTAFMRRALEDWEHAEEFAVPYTREQVERFSPKSRAIFEIQSARDLEILEKIYANSVLLGDDGPDGWGVKYAQGDFNMTSDSKLFPPRPVWEAKGYRPDEYSRWLLGRWRPMAELWHELGIDVGSEAVVNPGSDPAVNFRCVVPAEIELEEWLFDSAAGPERRQAEAQLVHGHLLKPGDVARTPWRLRCAQPPYDVLPIPRADIPAGIILSRDADAWIREDEVDDVALPLYEGRMIGQFDFSQKGWVSGKGRSAVWRDIPWEHKQIEPQFLMAATEYAERDVVKGRHFKTAIMDVTSSTNSRTVVAAALDGVPCGHKTPTLTMERTAADTLVLTAILNSFAFDYLIRLKLGGNSLIWSVLAETPASDRTSSVRLLKSHASGLALPAAKYGPAWTRDASGAAWRSSWSLGNAHRIRARASLDAVCLGLFGADSNDAAHVLAGCDHHNVRTAALDAKGFWRVDKDEDPELRHTVLTLVAFHDLEEKIRACGGDRDAGIEAFLSQNHGEGWMLPETLRLANYGLGHDERAKHPQPVASRLGPRFYDWQLAQSAEESWRECHLHARNLLGEQGYRALLDEIAARERGEEHGESAKASQQEGASRSQDSLW
jgi:hypothetical protein